jgi:imidazoleglycerol-phosphate dehydratase/histidinol-phosphatase
MCLKKAIFIDRDGTIIKEPEDEQIDSLEKLEFLPGVISALRSITSLDYELVMVSNQDGLGTDSFPEHTFYPAHNKMLATLAGEGITFDDELIDRTFPHENAPTRKPGTGMLGKYLSGDYDLAASFVIGDRFTDIQLAKNLGAKGILIQPQTAVVPSDLEPHVALKTTDWQAIAEFLRATERKAVVARKTAETNIYIDLDLDGHGENNISTGLKFFDHMLTQIPHHSGVSLTATCNGDLEVDEHHTMEDVALALGEALRKALGAKRGIDRYGFVLPMDECDAMVLMDLGGRIDFKWDVNFTREYVGDTPTEMFKHFFQSLCATMQCNMHIVAKGENNHHLAESIFKAFARALRMAIRRNVFTYELPSSKGIL